MRNVQLMEKNKKYIPCLPHNNCQKKNWFIRHEKSAFERIFNVMQLILVKFK
jgi:hypothetical protein